MTASSCDLDGCSVVFLEADSSCNKIFQAITALTNKGVRQIIIKRQITEEVIEKTKTGTFDAVLKLSKHGTVVPHKRLLIYMPGQ